MKTIVAETAEVYTGAAESLAALLRKKPDAVLALSAGRTMEGLFAVLRGMSAEGRLDLSRARVFAVTEFDGAPEALSCRRAIEAGLIRPGCLREENCVFLSEETVGDYERRIAAAGGLDMAVLGLGDKAQIGFNEAASPYASLSRRQKLSDATRRQNAARFGSFEAVPDYGWTMGIRTLVSAREILVLAVGEEKAEAAFKMLYARDDSVVPAAFLQLPMNVTVFLDRAAASKLSGSEYVFPV